MTLPERYTQLLMANGYCLYLEAGASHSEFDKKKAIYQGTVGLYREDVLSALNILADTQLFVLGGDVVQVANGPVRSVDNWDCSPLNGERAEDFRRRCIDTAKRYVLNYKEPDTGPALYNVVVSEGASLWDRLV